ncbi:DnaJ-class molecular chaperone [Neorhizobium galegae]|uniref:DnaJ C-terminal domain-containing protein n=1 Tax=Neorhizobium galegae TaxID=399 RepID=UPI001AE881FA|nr:DnaJ C-terminal domain-containing protein [Neorhizobium galegae]MBP2547757.1 DnaJ-class molecular chaperone [Neorhizobium galegae]
MRDPYSLLGVKKDAGADEIKAAWRSKAKSLHPDHNQDDPAATRRFAEMGQAYEVLKDPERRKRYDRAYETHQTILQQRENARQAEERAKAARAKAEQVMEELARANAQRAQNQANQNRANATAGASTLGGAEENPEDLINRIFGPAPSAGSSTASQAGTTGSRRSNAEAGAQAGQDHARTERPQPSSAKGQAGAAQTQRPAAESSNPDATRPEPTGQKVPPPLPLQAIELLSGLMRRIRGTAPPPEKAPDLSTTATVSLQDMLALNTATVILSDDREVRFPLEAGMTDGQVLRLIGQGLRLPGAQRGDLLVTLKIARDNRFHVEGFDLHTVLPISLEDAVLGTEAEVETPGGRVPVSIPAWTGSDQSVRIEGLGLANDAGGRGDLVVELRVVLWEKPDPKVIDLMRHMRHGLFV